MRLEKLLYYLVWLLVISWPISSMVYVEENLILLMWSTRIIGGCMIIMSLFSNKIMSIVTRNQTFFGSLFLFLTIALVASIINQLEADRYAIWGRYALYFLLLLSVSTITWSKRRYSIIMQCATFLVGVIVFLAILDYYGVIETVWMNEAKMGVLQDDNGNWIVDMTGPFNSRTTMAKYLLAVVPVAMYYALFARKMNTRSRLLWICVLILLMIGITMTFSRGAYLAIIGVLLLFMLHKKASVKGVVLSLLIIVLAAVNLKSTREFSGVRMAISHRISELNIKDVKNNPGDMWRIDAMKITIVKLMESPIGIGFSKLYNPTLRKEMNPHNNFIIFLQAAGPIGLVCFLVMLFDIFFKGLRKKNLGDNELMLYGCLLATILYGFTHESLGMVMFWIVAGMIYSIRSFVEVKE